MSEQDIGPIGVAVRVIKGGNRLMEIKAHCVCRDHNGQLQWEDDAIARIIVPAGMEMPKFVVEGPVHTRIISKEEE